VDRSPLGVAEAGAVWLTQADPFVNALAVLSQQAERRMTANKRPEDNPTAVLATNFGKPAALFQKFPHNDVFIAPGNGKQ
jgi:hypothetical protein